MQQQAERFGAKTQNADVREADLKATPKVLRTSEGTFLARTVVLATGANPRELGLPEERALLGRGVAYCAACDGMFYKDKTVAVIGGGNSAVADALILSRICKKVVIVHRRDTLRATKVYHDTLLNTPNVEFRWNSAVSELIHDEKLKAIRLRDVNSGEQSVLECDGVFVSVGRQPATELVKGQIELDAAGYIVADESTRTNIPGVFAVGDVRTKAVRQVVTAVADGAAAVHYAEQYLVSGE
jgi:thioredoxin reductase (NADPH)